LELPTMDPRPMVHERPQETIQTALGTEGLGGPRVLDDRRQLAAMTDQTAPRKHQSVHVRRRHASHEVHVETVERRTIRLATMQHLCPAQTRLHPFQAKELEQRTLPAHGTSPFLVVVPHVRLRRRTRVKTHPAAPRWLVRRVGRRHRPRCVGHGSSKRIRRSPPPPPPFEIFPRHRDLVSRS